LFAKTSVVQVTTGTTSGGHFTWDYYKISAILSLYRFRHCDAVRSTHLMTEQEQLAAPSASRSAVEVSINCATSSDAHRLTPNTSRAIAAL